jgi:hypothetical protein
VRCARARLLCLPVVCCFATPSLIDYWRVCLRLCRADSYVATFVLCVFTAHHLMLFARACLCLCVCVCWALFCAHTAWGSVQCVATLDFYQRLILVVLVPVVVVALLGSVPYLILWCQVCCFSSCPPPVRDTSRLSLHNRQASTLFCALLSVCAESL